MVFSGQFETDRHIIKYFPKDYKGVAVDVGAVDGRYMSNTLYLEDNLNWEVLCIEPNIYYYNQLVNNRKHSLNYAVSDKNLDDVDFHIFTMNNGNESSVSSLNPDQELIDYHKNHYHITLNKTSMKVNVRTLDYCIEEFNPEKVDLISIDTEGTELDVLKGFDINKWKPKLLVIEDNWESSTQIIKEYLEQFNYSLDKRVGVNDFFVRG